MFVVNENKRHNINVLRDLKNKLNVFDWIHFVCNINLDYLNEKSQVARKIFGKFI